MKNTSIEFINHASVIISYGKNKILTDPWYYGDSFHKGWNLLVEQSKDEINKILDNISYIWISHEHPDHFSVKFFMDFKDKIIENSIVILFQKTKDKRVASFLKKKEFQLLELPNKKKIELDENLNITCIRDGFYDSALFIEAPDTKILNLNDCEISSIKKAKNLFKIVGECDILLTQFSYAAWKGGIQNKSWRELAAREKIDTIRIQNEIFKPKTIIPFASFIYFSNVKNFYLNDSINQPKTVIRNFEDLKVNINVMKPFDVFNGKYDLNDNKKASIFWDDKITNQHSLKLNRYAKITFDDLNKSFKKYQKRIFNNNNKFLMKLARFLSPIKVFSNLNIKLDDLGKTINFDLFCLELKYTIDEPDIVMSSESLNFIFTNSFGFDTLTVNGCFEEGKKGGFIKSSKTLAIENMNNIGIYFNFNMIYNLQIIIIFIQRLRSVRNKIELPG
jgi:hypothetical protein